MTPPEAASPLPSGCDSISGEIRSHALNSPTGRIIAIDGLRAIAVCLVLAGHTVQGIWGQTRQILWAPLANSSLGVRIFFVLSGFLITRLLVAEQNLKGRISLRDFYIRRSLRIFPAFYFFIGVIGIMALGGWIEVSWQQLLSAATYTWNYAPLWYSNGPAEGSWLLGHLWTLSLEEQFYLAWPGLIILCGWRTARLSSLILPLLMPGIRVGCYYLFPDQRGQLGMMFHTAIDSILIGCAFALWEHRIPPQWRSHRGLFWICLAFVFIISPFLETAVRGYQVTVGYGLDAFCAGVLTLQATRSNRWSRLLSSGYLPLVGTWSYSIYLWQQLFLGSEGMARSGGLASSLAMTMTCALLSFYLIESPMLRLKSRFTQVKAADPATPPP